VLTVPTVLTRTLLATVCAASLLLTAPAHAGQNCDAKPPGVAQVAQSLELAARTAQWLDASGARVVVLARRGQNLDEWGLRYSHLGYAYRDEAANAWRVVHKLNQCGTASSGVYRQGLGEFFMDDLYRPEGGAVVPSAAVQDALLPLLQDNTRVATLHTPSYNMLAYPWSQRYQQSNQWALETLAYAMEPGASNRARAQAWLQFKGYQPTVLRIGAMKRLGARVGTAHIAFDDHPSEQRYGDRIATVTVDSVFTFLQASGLGGAAQALR